MYFLLEKVDFAVLPWLTGGYYHITPWENDMVHLKIDPWKRRFLLETIVLRVHVNFSGCTTCLAYVYHIFLTSLPSLS